MTTLKAVLVIVAVFVLLWLLRNAFARRVGTGSAKQASTKPQPMLVCAECGVHLPRDEALPGKGGVFCGEAHRAAFEKTRSHEP